MIFNPTILGGSSEPGELGTPTVSTSGLVTAIVTKSGVLEEGTSTTLQLSKQAAKTITPSSSTQTAVAAGKYTTGAVKVAAHPYKKIARGSLSLNRSSTFSVTGLSFKPTNIMVFGGDDYTASDSRIASFNNGQLLIYYDSSGTTSFVTGTMSTTSSSITITATYNNYGDFFDGLYHYVVWA